MVPTRLFHRFRYYLFRWKVKDRKELESLQWESEWKPVSRFIEDRGRRVAERRVLKRSQESFALRKEKRISQRRSELRCSACRKVFENLTTLREHSKEECPKQRRNPLRCEICRQTFVHRVQLIRHLPCPANREIIHPAVTERFAQWRQRGGILAAEERAEVLQWIEASTSEEVFWKACDRGDFSYRANLFKESNFENYRNDWWLCFLSYVRPNQMDAENPSAADRREAARIQREFVRSRPERQRQIIPQLFNLKYVLKEIARRGQPGRPSSPSAVTKNPQVRNTLKHYEGRQAAAKLNELGLDIPTLGSGMYSALKKLRDSLGVRNKRRVTSSQKKL